MKAINKLNDDFDKGKPIPANRLEIAEFAEAHAKLQSEERENMFIQVDYLEKLVSAKHIIISGLKGKYDLAINNGIKLMNENKELKEYFVLRGRDDRGEFVEDGKISRLRNKILNKQQ